MGVFLGYCPWPRTPLPSKATYKAPSRSACLAYTHTHPNPEGFLHLATPLSWIAPYTSFCFKGNFSCLGAQAKPRKRTYCKEGKVMISGKTCWLAHIGLTISLNISVHLCPRES